MVAQVAYTKNIPGMIPGLIADLGPTKIDSFAAEVVIEHGLFVSRGAVATDQVVLGTAVAIGISVRRASENDYKPAVEVQNGRYEITDTVGVMREGYIWAQFDGTGGAIDSAVTINAAGQVVSAGGGTALTNLNASVEKPAVAVNLEGAAGAIYVGLIKLGN